MNVLSFNSRFTYFQTNSPEKRSDLVIWKLNCLETIEIVSTPFCLSMSLNTNKN